MISWVDSCYFRVVDLLHLFLEDFGRLNATTNHGYTMLVLGHHAVLFHVEPLVVHLRRHHLIFYLRFALACDRTRLLPTSSLCCL